MEVLSLSTWPRSIQYVIQVKYAAIYSNGKLQGNASTCYSLTQEMIEEYTYSAENLIHHFNAILRASDGFKVAMKNLQELQDREGLDKPAAEYMVQMLELLPKFGSCA